MGKDANSVGSEDKSCFFDWLHVGVRMGVAGQTGDDEGEKLDMSVLLPEWSKTDWSGNGLTLAPVLSESPGDGDPLLEIVDELSCCCLVWKLFSGIPLSRAPPPTLRPQPPLKL